MPENRMLIVPADLVKKIDDNRGDLSREEFIDFLMSSRLEQGAVNGEERYVTKESLAEFQQDTKELLRSFLEFFVNYGLELGHGAGGNDMESLTKGLHELGAPRQPAGRRQKVEG